MEQTSRDDVLTTTATQTPAASTTPDAPVLSYRGQPTGPHWALRVLPVLHSVTAGFALLFVALFLAIALYLPGGRLHADHPHVLAVIVVEWLALAGVGLFCGASIRRRRRLKLVRWLSLILVVLVPIGTVAALMTFWGLPGAIATLDADNPATRPA